MKRRRHTPEQAVRKLREADRMLGEGAEVPEVAKALEVSEVTYHRWRARFGGMKAEDVKRLKQLERENSVLKRIVADRELENVALKELARETSEPVAPTPRDPGFAGASRALGAAGMPDCRAASLNPAARAGAGRG